MYIARVTFIDPAQPTVIYHAGQPYPRPGDKPAGKRAAQLAGQGLLEEKTEKAEKGEDNGL